MKLTPHIMIFCAAALLLGACEGTKKELGLIREAPDEYSVVKRAPLEMPPDFTLRPPRPGAARPQEELSAEQARAAVFGGEDGTGEAQPQEFAPEDGESALLLRAGADRAQPNIRQQVDAETARLEPKSKPVAERLLGWTSSEPEQPAASVVDAEKEAERLRQNRDAGKPATEGQTPSVEN